MTFKVGDTAILKKPNMVNETYDEHNVDWVPEMYKNVGKQVTIYRLSNEYRYRSDNDAYTKEMYVSIQLESKRYATVHITSLQPIYTDNIYDI